MPEENCYDCLAVAKSGDEVRVARETAGDSARFDVPNFDAAVRMYQEGTGSVEESVFHRGKYASVWNREKLAKVLSLAGWDISGPAVGDHWEDGAWLRVMARRVERPVPKLPMSDVEAIMSLPRVAWTETMGATHLSCARLGIDFVKATGVFWGQCMQRMMERIVDNGNRKYILTIDYDSIFTEDDIIRLWQVMETRPEIDALFPLQIGRDRSHPLLTMKDENGQRIKQVPAEVFRAEAVPVETGHFGLTLIRTSALARMRKPWFKAEPNDEGVWDGLKIDDDIWFWKRFESSGNRVFVCPRVRIGHLQLVITWPGEDLKAIHQYTSVYNEDGRPAECMRY